MSTENNSGSTPATDTQINFWGKLVAGILLMGFTGFAIYTIIAYWPNKIPPPGNKCITYQNKRFHIQLLDSASCNCIAMNGKVCPVDTATTDTTSRAQDTTRNDSMAVVNTATTDTMRTGNQQVIKLCDTIQLDTILLILVAAAGFLGNMIHIATSFTTFVGNGDFKRSWILWYFVKPFTAAGLAVVFYFVFRAGLLNAADSGSSINLYGLMSLACLTGLFTDIATLKLKEVFTTLFKPKEDRRDALNATPKITAFAPATLNATQANAVKLTGESLDKDKLTVLMDNVPVTGVTVTPTSITFSYTLNAQQQTQSTVKLLVNGSNGQPVYTQDMPVGTGGQPAQPPVQPGGGQQPAPGGNNPQPGGSGATGSITVQPTTISGTAANAMTITGQGFDDNTFVTIGDIPVNAPQVTATSISFSYSVPPNLAGQASLPLKIMDVNGNVLFTAVLTVQS